MSELGGLNETAFRTAWDTFAHAQSNPRMIDCPRCEGRGYHHGFGERGEDPDWCNSCGGGGVTAADGEDERPLIEAIQAYLKTTGGAS